MVGDTYEPVDATRESSENRPTDHIDVTFEATDGGRRILRYDVAGYPDARDQEVARFLYEIYYDEVRTDTADTYMIEAGADYIEDTFDVDTQV
jgi:hypothetical protein